MRTLRAGLLAAVAAMAGWIPAASADPAETLVTVVTSPDPQTQLMALVLTLQAVKQGATARILLCGPGGDIAVTDATGSATAPQAPNGMSPQGFMTQIMRSTGTPVQVCAIYLPNKGKDASVLIEGVTVASPPEMAGRLIAAGTRVLSF